ncbi:nuclear transport factor 2 family protein [Ningiella sp. W23]|uniref:nuclear transport factor 2 family protein n=1 Tax=Ningiella sp. W23 TaxID=3023715 RepID=UPI00375825D6
MQTNIKLVFTLLIVLSASVQAGDSTKPEDAVNAYIKGVSTGSGKHVMQAFSDTAFIQYYNQDAQYQHFSRDEFAKVVDNGQNWDAKIEITNMLITGNAANATVNFTWGEKSEHGYVDYLNLLYDGENWHITNKVAQYIER